MLTITAELTLPSLVDDVLGVGIDVDERVRLDSLVEAQVHLLAVEFIVRDLHAQSLMR